MKLILLTLTLLLASCSTVTPPTAPTPEPITPPTPGLITKGWHERYETLIASSVGPEHLKYNSSKLYWQKFYKSLAAAESTFNPFDIYHENTLGSGGVDPWAVKKGFKDTAYWSMGLFQLSYSDSDYYGCKFDYQADRLNDMRDNKNSIFVPELQIDCTLKIMERLLKKNGTPFFNENHYWAVLRPNRKQWDYFFYYYKKWIINAKLN